MSNARLAGVESGWRLERSVGSGHRGAQLLGVGLVVGALIASLVVGLFARDAPPGPTAEELAALARELDAEVQAREELAEQVLALRVQVELLRGVLTARAAGEPSIARRPVSLAAKGGSQRSGAEAPADEPSSEAGPAAAPGDAASLPGHPWFDVRGLHAAGLSDAEIERLRDRWEQYELEKLYIQDQAVRDGKLASPMTRQQRDELELSIRDDLGEEDYDRLLFASGQPNRVQVQDVLENAPGRQAGLEAGDIIISYDGARVFRPRDLRTSIAQVNAGDLVWMEVESADGGRKDVRIPSGPIGIKMMPVRRSP